MFPISVYLEFEKNVPKDLLLQKIAGGSYNVTKHSSHNAPQNANLISPKSNTAFSNMTYWS